MNFDPTTLASRAMAAGQPMSFRLPQAAIEMIEDLEAETKLKRTAVLIQAIRIYHRQECGPKKSPKKPKDSS